MNYIGSNGSNTHLNGPTIGLDPKKIVFKKNMKLVGLR